MAAQISVLLGNHRLKKAEDTVENYQYYWFFLLPQDPIWLDTSLLLILYLFKMFIFCSFLHYFFILKNVALIFFILILNLLLPSYILCPRELPYMPGPLITCKNFRNKILCTFMSIIFLKYKLRSPNLTFCICMVFFLLTRRIFQLKNYFLLIWHSLSLYCILGIMWWYGIIVVNKVFSVGETEEKQINMQKSQVIFDQ